MGLPQQAYGLAILIAAATQTTMVLNLEGNYQASSELELFLSIGLLQTEIDSLSVFDLDVNNFVSRNNRDQAKAPNWQYSLGGWNTLLSQTLD